MPQFNGRAGWMEFPQLRLSEGLTAIFTLAYKVTDNSSERWSSRFVDFKAGKKPALFGGSRLLYAAVPELIRSLNLVGNQCSFVCALSSAEALANPQRAIPFIAAECARIVGASNDIAKISKNPHNKIHFAGGLDGRRAELDKANYTAAAIAAPYVFIFDDFVTNGDTLSRVAKAIRATSNVTAVYGIALAKTERQDWCPNPQNDHVPLGWDTVWSEAEAEAAAA